MSNHKLEIECNCKSCGATGLYVGIGERGGAGVVCHTCKGTGRQVLKIEYEDFNGKRRRKEVRRVFRANPGICIGEDPSRGLALEDFGGLSYEDWWEGKEFTPGTEDRKHTCPAWFYQSADYEKKPEWDECRGCGAFRSCRHFSNKAACWERWDKEFAA